MKNILQKLFKHTFRVDSNIENAKVIYIVDAYDRSKNITCYTPCKITVPWDACRRANQAKLLIEKSGYSSEIVNFKRGADIFIQLVPQAFILGLIASFVQLKYDVPFYYFIIIFIILVCKLSLGSSDLYVDLKEK